ncbi:S1 family peptidase [Niveispirillum irakense]|uniref:S1 family peptidase n=1 Tax=Niveispirillum irakense TaxID=34011 RepID=UPI00041B0521|nr:serine protease [Niveispirillum irakense]
MTADERHNSTGGGDNAARTLLVVERRRSWLAPLVALVIALVVLLILLIPGVLVYPDPGVAVRSGPAVSPDAVADSNRALADRIAELRRLLDARVCVAEAGKYQLPDGSTAPAMPPPALSAVPDQVTPEGQPFAGSLLDLLDRSTVLVLQVGPDESLLGNGTGIYVAQGAVLTNQHVVAGPPGSRLIVVGRTGGVSEATVRGTTRGSEAGEPDFALLAVARPDPQALPLDFAPPVSRLSGVVAAGFPGLVMESDEDFRRLLSGDTSNPPAPAVTEGVVTAIQAQDGASLILHTAQITPGNSGGPLVDRCGRLVGVNTFIRAQEVGRMNYALSAGDATTFLRDQGVTPRVLDNACIPAPLTEPAAPARGASAPDAAPPDAPAQGE